MRESARSGDLPSLRLVSSFSSMRMVPLEFTTLYLSVVSSWISSSSSGIMIC